jgi:CRP-like cAMP-binding protein
VSSISIPISGTVRVQQHGRDLGVIEPGHLIGTGLALTGDPSPVEATFTRSARYLSWPLQSLRSFMDRRPDLRVALQGLANRDLALKLGQMLSSPADDARV